MPTPMYSKHGDKILVPENKIEEMKGKGWTTQKPKKAADEKKLPTK